jgi:hypothetical protein
MGLQENKFIRWGAHLVGLLAAVFGFAFQEQTAIAFFGAYLIFEFWRMEDKIKLNLEGMHEIQKEIKSLNDGIDEKITNALQYEYLNEAELIWGRAIDLLRNARPNDEIRSTASTPNDPDFERSIFERVVYNQISYKRIVCYYSDSNDDALLGRFPATDLIKGNSEEELLKTYDDWYIIFYKTWKNMLKDDQTGRIEGVGMKAWHQALAKLAQHINRFEVRSHNSDIPSDYFIVNPFGDHHWKAVLGFPRLKKEGMRSGFSTTNHSLAHDLGLNWQRLWDRHSQ